MSFKRKSPGVFVSTVIGTLAGAAIVGGAMVLFTLPALAQTRSPAVHVSGDFGHPFGDGIGKPDTFITRQKSN